MLVQEREPARHTRLFPSPPQPRYLIVVRRDAEPVYRHLAEAFRGVRGVDVILDRRRTDAPPPAERRGQRGDFDVFGVRLVRS